MMVKQFHSIQSHVVAIAALVVFMHSFSGLSFAAEYNLVWPVEAGSLLAPTTAPVIAKAQTAGPNEQYITCVSVVAIPTNAVEICAQMTRDDVMRLSFFNQSGGRNATQTQIAYRVAVKSVKSNANGVVSLSGKVEGPDIVEGHAIESFVLTTSKDGFMITMQDFERKILYRVVGDPRRGEAVVREIDLTKVPPSYDGAPLLPPTDAITSKGNKSP